MKILILLLLSSMVVAMPQKAKKESGNCNRLNQTNNKEEDTNCDNTLVNPTTQQAGGGAAAAAQTAHVLELDPYGNSEEFLAMGLNRRTAIRELITRIENNDTEVMRMVAMELAGFFPLIRHMNLNLPDGLHENYQLASPELLIWYLTEFYLYGDARPAFDFPEGDKSPSGVLIALAYVHQIELIIYETRNDSIANFSREYFLKLEEGKVFQRVALLYCSRNRCLHGLRLPEGHIQEAPVRLERVQAVPGPLPALHRRDRPPQMTLVLDLDETLVHYHHQHGLLLRPHVRKVLRRLRRIEGLEIVLWTASKEPVALPVVRQLEQDGVIFDAIIYRDRRWYKSDKTYVKDLSLLGRPMERMILVDNKHAMLRLHPANGIVVPDFVGQEGEDATLQNLLEVVRVLMQGFQQEVPVADMLTVLAGAGTRLEFQLNENLRGCVFRALSKQPIAPAALNPTPPASAE